MKFNNWIITKYFGLSADTVYHLGPGPAPGRLLVKMPNLQFWQKEPFLRKLKCIFKRNWVPDESMVKEAAGEILAVEVFGSEDDYAPELYRNIGWFYHKEWPVDHLSEADLVKAEALDKMTLMTRLRLGKSFIPMMALQMKKRNLLVCSLTHMMLVKIPVISFQFFLDIDSRFSFHSIRKAKHPHADDLIAYLYDLLQVQQKIAITFHDFLLQLHAIEQLKDPNIVTNHTVDAGRHAGEAITYLKASIEKTVVLLGLIFGIDKLDGIGEHKKRLNKLLPAIPEKTRNTFYYELIKEFISSENLATLNNYRSGLLHKKGISHLQPHTQFNAKNDTTLFKEIFFQLHEQHAKGTAVLLSALAILTDDLVDRDKPEIDPFVLISEMSEAFSKTMETIYNQVKGIGINDGT